MGENKADAISPLWILWADRPGGLGGSCKITTFSRQPIAVDLAVWQTGGGGGKFLGEVFSLIRPLRAV